MALECGEDIFAHLPARPMPEIEYIVGVGFGCPCETDLDLKSTGTQAKERLR